MYIGFCSLNCNIFPAQNYAIVICITTAPPSFWDCDLFFGIRIPTAYGVDNKNKLKLNCEMLKIIFNKIEYYIPFKIVLNFLFEK